MEAEKSVIKVSTNLVPGKGLLPGSWTAVFVVEGARVLFEVSFNKGTYLISEGSTLMS